MRSQGAGEARDEVMVVFISSSPCQRRAAVAAVMQKHVFSTAVFLDEPPVHCPVVNKSAASLSIYKSSCGQRNFIFEFFSPSSKTI